MRTRKIPAKMAKANALLPPDLIEVMRDFTAQQRRNLAGTFKDWAQQLYANADFIDGRKPLEFPGVEQVKKGASTEYYGSNSIPTRVNSKPPPGESLKAGPGFSPWALC